MLEISNVSLPMKAWHTTDTSLLKRGLIKALKLHCKLVEADIEHIELLRHSIDARKKSNIHLNAKLAFSLTPMCKHLEEELLAKSQVSIHAPFEPLDCKKRRLVNKKPPVVVGMGPAGLFCALYLARLGLCPVVVERGSCVDERTRQVEVYKNKGLLNVNSNIQFGEGGAGTFSDGKLTTNTKNPLTKTVLHDLVAAGAPDVILVDAHPHIGSDKLGAVVKSLRQEIIAKGGRVLFDTQMTNFSVEAGAINEVELSSTLEGSSQCIETDTLVLACGHSARDTFELLRDKKLPMEQKPFSVGVRIEHPQTLINQAQWGCERLKEVASSEYKLACHLPSKRGVYTFCMCPGGEVVCAASEPNTVVVNGMSNFARDGKNANSAVLVGVDPQDFGSSDVLAGVEFQRAIERKAYEMSDGIAAPAERFEDFALRKSNAELKASSLLEPSYARGVLWRDLHEGLPDFVGQALIDGIQALDKRLRGFAHPEAVLTGFETRSSSPVRMLRNDQFESGIPGLFPCGEGAGFAGGIMSAAVDGIRVALSVAERYPLDSD